MTGRRIRPWRMLVAFSGLAMALGAREYAVSRTTGRVLGPCEASAAACFAIPASATPGGDSVFWERHSRIADLLGELNPDHPDTHVVRAMQALQDGDPEESFRRFQEAVDAGIKHNGFLFKVYAELLLHSGADWRAVNAAVNRWRENHPLSPQPLAMAMGRGPETESEHAVLRGALAEVSWIESSWVERNEDAGGEAWRLYLTFRPGRTVDVREAVAASSVLLLPEEQRLLYEVACHTFEECSVVPRRAARMGTAPGPAGRR